MGGTTGEVVPGGSCVAAETDVVGAVSFEMGTTAAGSAGQDSGLGVAMGGARYQVWGGNGHGGRGTLKSGSSTFHKSSSDPGSKTR